MNEDRLRLEQLRLHKLIEQNWMLSEEVKIEKHLFSTRSLEETENPLYFLLNLISDPDNFYFTCKHIFNLEIAPFQAVLLKELWTHKYPMFIATRGGSKSWLLALYSMLRALLIPGSKVILAGAGFRQSKVVFSYCETFWYNAPVLRSMAGDARNAGPHHGTDQHTLNIGDSIITALPIGDGEKIRGQRSSCTICDEFKSHNPEIYETVLQGFSSVSQNPIESMKRAGRVAKMKELGMWDEKQQSKFDEINIGNQTILSGTAYYVANHFYRYWERYRQIINSQGDPKKINEIFNGSPPPNFDYKDFTVIRMPVERLPPGFMDTKNVALSRATVSLSNYNIEYGAVFAKDSDGFFRRTLIDACTAPVKYSSGEKISFSAVVRGNPHCKYVFAIDPAADRDNFAVVILEIQATHRRVVYCWTTNRLSHRAKIKAGLVNELEFYSYCTRKIRDLMKVFPCERIICDGQGGGVAVEESFHDKDKIETGEKLIWRVIDPDEEFWADDKEGLHILEMASFSSAQWTSEANHGMKKDLEDKCLIFPEFDHIILGLAAEEDGKLGRIYDTLEDCASEIEDLKDELTTIVMSQVGITGRDRWDTPEIKTAENRKGRLRKDRYSALLMANMAARIISRTEPPAEYQSGGGFVGTFGKDPAQGEMYTVAPEWFRNQQKNGYAGISMRRG